MCMYVVTMGAGTGGVWAIPPITSGPNTEYKKY